MKKILFAILVVAFLASPALAGNRPEFDAVGLDAVNLLNDAASQFLVEYALDPNGLPIEIYSDWEHIPVPLEFFKNTAGLAYPDPCFGFLGLTSALTDAYNQGTYHWRIVLQMKPESDINLNIYDCVMKENQTNVLTGADETGYYRAPWGQLIFVPSANPTVTVTALPGAFATPGFPTAGFILDAREMPSLTGIPLNQAVYASKAMWNEAILMVLPATGTTNLSGTANYDLKQGDMIDIQIAIPFNNVNDVRYGHDNVILKYIGIVGTEFTIGVVDDV
jgi:hypothetical protein